MGEHKQNPVAVFFRENPWAPDFKPLFGRRQPRGKGSRRMARILKIHPNTEVACPSDIHKIRVERPAKVYVF